MKVSAYDLIDLIGSVMDKVAEQNNIDTSVPVSFDEEQVLNVVVNVIENMGIEINE